MKSDIKYIIKRIIVGVSIALILMLIKSNVFAAGIVPTYRSIYTYEKDSSTYTNQINSLTRISSGGIYWNRIVKNRYRLRLQFDLINNLDSGYYNIMFNTINQDYIKFNGYIVINNVTFSCESWEDETLVDPTSSTSGGIYTNITTGSQSWLCSNVYFSNYQYMNIYLNGEVGMTTNHYVYISEYINFVPVSNLDVAIQQQTEQQHQDSQNTQNAINNVNDSLTSDSTPSGSDTDSAYSNFGNSTAENGVITQLITLPITLFTSINNNINTSCSRFDMGTLLGTHIYFNCINPSRYIGSQLWSVIDILASGFFVWYIGKKLIKVFENLSSMKEGDPVGD